MNSYDALITQIRAKRDHYELILRQALREAATANPALLTDAWQTTHSVDYFVEAHVFDLEGLPLDDDPGLKWCSGQLFAADELLRFVELQQAGPGTPAPAVAEIPPPSPVTPASARVTFAYFGYACPACGSTMVQERTTLAEEGVHYQQMCCGMCGTLWSNAWELDRVLVEGQGDMPDIYERHPRKPTPRVRTDPTAWTELPNHRWESAYKPRTIGEVWEEIKAMLPAYGVNLDDYDYAGVTSSVDRQRLFPEKYRWLVSFAVRGDSEGWFIHTAVVRNTSAETQELETLFIAKTFLGWDTAQAMVRALSIMLDA